MTVEGIEDYTTDELIAELINRTTFAGLVIWHRGDAVQGQLPRGDVVLTKSAPLSKAATEALLNAGLSQLPKMFGEQS